MPIPDLFAYIAPNDDTAPRHQRIREAQAACAASIEEDIVTFDVPPQARFARVSAACKRFHDELIAVCPPSADLSAAIRCVRLARMAANEAIAQPAYRQRRHADLAADQLTLARWQACASVALALPTELPPLA